MKKAPKRVEVEKRGRILDDFFKVDEAQLRFERFDGQMSEPVRRLVFERGDSVAAVVFNTDSRKAILVNQFKYPTYREGEESGWITELMAGMVDEGESPEEAMRRELREELGYAARKIVPLGSFYVSPGGTSERILLYYTEVDDAGKVEEGGGAAEESEDIEHVEYDLGEVRAMLSAGHFEDAKTIIGLNWLRERMTDRKDTPKQKELQANQCFVIMPFGRKHDDQGNEIDFDEIYEYMIRRTIQDDLGIDCIRCDKIEQSGSIHRDMFNHIYESDVAVVDITTLNANVFYELGARHALRSGVTVLIRKKGTQMPFNIQGIKVIEYDTNPAAVEAARNSIANFVRNGIRTDDQDSPVLDVLPKARKSLPAKRIEKFATYDYKITEAENDKYVGLATGDITGVRNIDIWVNSENTNMQMARFHDSAISGSIRYHGAGKKAGRVTRDTIADDLAEQIGKEGSGGWVQPGTILVTKSGELKKTHGVEKIFHAATVQGQPGRGYSQLADVEVCVRNALETAKEHRSEDGEPLRSILFPMMGAGTGGGELRETAHKLLRSMIAYLEAHPESPIDHCYLLTFTDRQKRACEALLSGYSDVVRVI